MQKYSYHVLYCRSMLLITGWILLLAIVQRRYRSARQQAMPCLLTLFSATICYCIYQTIFEGKALQIYYNIARKYDFDRIQKFFCLLFITFCFFADLCAADVSAEERTSLLFLEGTGNE